MNIIEKTFQYGEHTVQLRSGEIARQALSAVVIAMADTVVLVTVVAKATDAKEDFFPLTVNYQEKSYAAGRIPGGFLRREGKASEREVLIARLIDRPIRPLFAKGFTDEVQIIATVLSLNPEVDPDIVAMLGTSAALAISGLPFQGPIGAARVGYKQGKFLLNPPVSEWPSSQLDLVVAGTAEAVLMVESEAQLLPDDTMLEAVVFGHEAMQSAIAAIRDFAAQVQAPAWPWQAFALPEAVKAFVRERAQAPLLSAYQIAEKAERRQRIADIFTAIKNEALAHPDAAAQGFSDNALKTIFHDLESEVVRSRILQGAPRIDGRDRTTVRPLAIRTGVLPRTHGSALFTRGETQALVVATLGTKKDAQMIDNMEGVVMDNFLFHYNFPPFCVGETGQVGAPKRREIGHGRLAKRGVQAVMPDAKTFPYVVRVVSEITESNGSSSMASVCGACLALMDAGVPLKAPVAGVAMGLIKEGADFAVLTDILGDEDHLGDMDFKVAGSRDGVSALQMDIKINGITKEIMAVALRQAKAGRLHILAAMTEVLAQPRSEMSPYAPRFARFRINPDKIRDVIGKGGAMIRSLTEGTGVEVEIDDNGWVQLASVDAKSAALLQQKIEGIAGDLEVGSIHVGKVQRLSDFGAFVAIAPGREGLVHISQISEARIDKVSDVLKEGDTVRIKVLEPDKQGRLRFSMKEVAQQ